MGRPRRTPTAHRAGVTGGAAGSLTVRRLHFDNAREFVFEAMYGLARERDTPTMYFSLKVTEVDTPSNHREAMRSKDKPHWLDAEIAEIATMERKFVWILIPRDKLPPGANLVKSSWAFKIKRGAKGEITKFKARLCAQGFTQKDGIDFDRTFSPTMRHSSLRLLIGVAIRYGLNADTTLDFTRAYLNTPLPKEEKVYTDCANKSDTVRNLHSCPSRPPPSPRSRA